MASKVFLGGWLLVSVLFYACELWLISASVMLCASELQRQFQRPDAQSYTLDCT